MFRRGGSIAGRGGHSGGGNRSDEERKGRKRRIASDPARARCSASDGGRKRGARKYTNYGLAAPPAYAWRDMEEYDRRMEMAAVARGSRYEPGNSSGAGSSTIARAPLPPPKREEEEEEQG